ncbi:hypothetical protein MMC29_000291 [Sticta canariensis]|nr:hypothetical protein [Sticta canariensis]
MKNAIKITGILSVAWWIAATVAFALVCIPVSKTWQPQTWTSIPNLPESPGHCYTYKEFFVGVEIPNMVLDFWVVAMPVFKIHQLQLSLRYKISISLIFVLAGFDGLLSVIRLAVIGPNASPYSNHLGLWILLQLAFAVICCSLPTYKPLLPRKNFLHSWLSSMRSRLSRRSRSTGRNAGKNLSSIGSKDGRRNKYEDIHTEDLDDLMVSTTVVGGKDASNVERDYPVNAIKMTNTFDVV